MSRAPCEAQDSIRADPWLLAFARFTGGLPLQKPNTGVRRKIHSGAKEPRATRFHGGCERAVVKLLPFDNQFTHSSKRFGDADGLPSWGDATSTACPN